MLAPQWCLVCYNYNVGEEEKENDSPPPPPPSNAEVVHALDIIRRRVCHNGLDTDPLTQVENIITKDMIANITQKKISDYFCNP